MKLYQEHKQRGSNSFPLDIYKQHLTNYMVELHWHPEIEILYGREGEVAVYASEEHFTLKEGEICFINPEELHSYTPITEGPRYDAIVFDASLFRFQDAHFFEKEFTEPVMAGMLKFPRKITKSHPQYDLLRSIIYPICNGKSDNKAMIFAGLLTLFAALQEYSLMEKAIEGAVVDKRMDDIKKCIHYMRGNYSDRITLSELADLVHMSTNYFCSYFKKQTGLSPFTQLNYIRVKQATQLLVQSDDSIAAIAEQCGFENVSFFIRKFKEVQGCTPSAYRKRN